MNQWTKLCASVAFATLVCTSHAQILIGQTAGYSGQVAAGVKETADGAMLYIDAVNAKLSVADLQALNARSVTEQKKSAEIASAWLKEKGLA